MSCTAFAPSLGYDPNYDTDPCEGCRLELHFCQTCGIDVDHGENSCSHCLRAFGSMFQW